MVGFNFFIEMNGVKIFNKRIILNLLSFLQETIVFGNLIGANKFDKLLKFYIILSIRKFLL